MCASVCLTMWRSTVQHTTAENFLFFLPSLLPPHFGGAFLSVPENRGKFCLVWRCEKKTRARKPLRRKSIKGFFSEATNFLRSSYRTCFLPFAVIIFFPPNSSHSSALLWRFFFSALPLPSPLPTSQTPGKAISRATLVSLTHFSLSHPKNPP